MSGRKAQFNDGLALLQLPEVRELQQLSQTPLVHSWPPSLAGPARLATQTKDKEMLWEEHVPDHGQDERSEGLAGNDMRSNNTAYAQAWQCAFIKTLVPLAILLKGLCEQDY